MARRRVFSRAHRPRKSYEWETLSFQKTNHDLAINTASLLTTVGAAVEDADQTLVRTRGKVTGLLNAGSASEDCIVAIGIAVLESRAIAAGVASLPRPGSDRNSDAFVYVDYLSVSSGAEAAVVPDFLMDTLSIDSKAMRKLSQELSVVVIAETVQSSDQGGQIQIWGAIQLLAMKV